MTCTILEDHSPYYIIFTYPGFQEVVDYCKKFKALWILDPAPNTVNPNFNHTPINGKYALTKINLPPALQFQESRVSLFITKPGGYYVPHKDGADHRVSINFPIQILDKDCVTQWYSDEQMTNWPIDEETYKMGHSRENTNFMHSDKNKLTPLKSVCFQEGACILFNTDIYHDFDNTQSAHTRVILTLRLKNAGKMYFDDVKKILFGEKETQNDSMD